MTSKTSTDDAGNERSERKGFSNLNLKVTEDERWAFKEWCAKHRTSQVDAFRRGFELLERYGMKD